MEMAQTLLGKILNWVTASTINQKYFKNLLVTLLRKVVGYFETVLIKICVVQYVSKTHCASILLF